MFIFEAVVLGIVQGLGEFLPISSSAHLVLVPWLLGWHYSGLTFDVALHMGTLLAVICYFWRDWVILIKHGLSRSASREKSLFWYIIVATIPGAIFGYLFEKQAETVFREPLLIGVMLIIMGLFLFLADSRSSKRKGFEQLNFTDSLLIGVSQALAIIPGISRAGITMTAGRLLGLEREAVARFSFLLSTPIIFGAGLMQLGKIAPTDINAPFIIGMLVAALVGFVSIEFLLNYLTRHNFVIFVWYRLLLGAIVIAVALFK